MRAIAGGTFLPRSAVLKNAKRSARSTEVAASSGIRGPAGERARAPRVGQETTVTAKLSRKPPAAEPNSRGSTLPTLWVDASVPEGSAPTIEA